MALEKVVALLGLTGLAACAGASGLAVRITAPGNGDTTGPTLVIRLAAQGVRVVRATGTAVPGEGHHHLFLDVDPGPADSIIRTGPGIFHLGSGVDSLRLDSLPPGSHRLIAVFAAGNHLPTTGVHRDSVRFVVR